MRISFRTFRVALVAVLFTGCITIEENYAFKKDGSGTMEYVVDMSEMGELLKGLEGMAGEKGGKDGLGDMTAADLSDNVDLLKKIPGIKSVKLNTKQEWVQRLSFGFKDLTALNAALNVLLPDSSGQKHDFFAWDGKTLVRTNNMHAYEFGSGMSKAGEEEPAEGEESPEADMGAMLGAMKYKYSFKFAEAVGTPTTAEGVLVENPGEKEVRMSTDFDAIAKDPKALDLRIPTGK